MKKLCLWIWDVEAACKDVKLSRKKVPKSPTRDSTYSGLRVTSWKTFFATNIPKKIRTLKLSLWGRVCVEEPLPDLTFFLVLVPCVIVFKKANEMFLRDPESSHRHSDFVFDLFGLKMETKEGRMSVGADKKSYLNPWNNSSRFSDVVRESVLRLGTRCMEKRFMML